MPKDSNKSKVSVDRVNVIRDRLIAATARIETAMRYVMFPEVRRELKGVQADLAEMLAQVNGK